MKEMQELFRFLIAKLLRTKKIYWELCTVYGDSLMGEGSMRQWYIIFENGRTQHTHIQPSNFNGS